MDLIDQLRELSARISSQLEHLATEEATKNAAVMPFIRSLGYDVFNPLEVVPEFTADVGTKKGEKVDYAILRDGAPIMLFECKVAGAKLSVKHASQLYRYYTVTHARVGILTNGTEFQFFSDLDSPNRMDDRPFFVFNLLDFDERAVEELKRFSKRAFDVDEMLSAAQNLKHLRGIKAVLKKQLEDPDEDFVRLLAARVSSRRMTKQVLEEFTETVARAFRAFVKERIQERFASAMDGDAPVVVRERPEPTAGAEPAEAAPPETDSDVDSDDGITTTEEELAAFYAVKAILHGHIDLGRVAMRDQKTYCALLVDDNNRKPICRLWFNRAQKYVGLFDDQKKEERVPIERVDDLYGMADRIRAGALRFA